MADTADYSGYFVERDQEGKVVRTMKPNNKAFRVAMAHADFITITALARCLDLGYHVVQTVVAGKAVPGPKRRARFAAALGVSEAILWEPGPVPAAEPAERGEPQAEKLAS